MPAFEGEKWQVLKPQSFTVSFAQLPSEAKSFPLFLRQVKTCSDYSELEYMFRCVRW